MLDSFSIVSSFIKDEIALSSPRAGVDDNGGILGTGPNDEPTNEPVFFGPAIE